MAEPIKILLQRRTTRRNGLQHPGDAAEFGLHAGGDDDAATTAISRTGSGEDHVAAVTEGQRGHGQRKRGLFHGQGFPRQRCLLHLQVAGFKQPAIRGNPVAGTQDHYIPRHQFPSRDLMFVTVPEHGGRGRRHPAQRFDRALSPIFLHKPEQCREQHDDGDGDGLDAMTQKRGQGRGD